MSGAMPLIELEDAPAPHPEAGDARGDALAVVVDAEVTSYIMGAMTGERTEGRGAFWWGAWLGLRARLIATIERSSSNNPIYIYS